MFESIKIGDDQFSDKIREQEQKAMREEKDAMDQLSRIEITCNQIIKNLNRLQEDLNTVERKLDTHNEIVKNKMIQICDIVEEINDTIINR